MFHRFTVVFAGGGRRSTTVLSRFFSARHSSTVQEASSFDHQKQRQRFSSTETNKNAFVIGVTGSGGLIGTALQDELQREQPTIEGRPIHIVCMKRGTTVSTDCSSTVTWNPHGTTPHEIVHPDVLSQFDALIHLSGENISTGMTGYAWWDALGIRPWTQAKKQEILDSRVQTTSALSQALVGQEHSVDFLVASGVGVYGNDFDRTSIAATESTDISQTTGFLADVSRQWEAAAMEAAPSNSRIVTMRNGVVLSTNGGAMAKLYPIFFMGGGGVVGSGQQYFPFISARDMARSMIHILQTKSLKGPVNLLAPAAGHEDEDGCTNADFTQAMGQVMNRPTVLPFPSFAVDLMFGEMGHEILLGGTHASPKALLESGFVFRHPTVHEAVQSAIEETTI